MPAPDPVTSTRASEWSMVTLIGSRPEHLDQPVHGSLGPPDDRRLVGAPQGVRYHDDPGFRESQAVGGRGGEYLEGFGGEHHGGCARLFELYEVVDTPRRARTSIGRAGEDQLDLLAEGLEDLGGTSGCCVGPRPLTGDGG